MLTIALKLKTCTGSLLSLAIICLPLQNLAVTVESVPNPEPNDGIWVTDMADVGSDSTQAKITNLEAQNNNEIAVVTVPEIAPASSPKQKPHITKKTQSDKSFGSAVLFGFLIVVAVALGLLFNNRSRRGSHASGGSSSTTSGVVNSQSDYSGSVDSFSSGSSDCSGSGDSFSGGSCDGGDAGGDF